MRGCCSYTSSPVYYSPLLGPTTSAFQGCAKAEFSERKAHLTSPFSRRKGLLDPAYLPEEFRVGCFRGLLCQLFLWYVVTSSIGNSGSSSTVRVVSVSPSKVYSV